MTATPKNTDKPQADAPVEPAKPETLMRCIVTDRSLLIGRIYHGRRAIVDLPETQANSLSKTGKIRILGCA